MISRLTNKQVIILRNIKYKKITRYEDIQRISDTKMHRLKDTMIQRLKDTKIQRLKDTKLCKDKQIDVYIRLKK